MRVGCLFFPHFSVQVEARDNSAIPGKPIIIGGSPHELRPVHDASKEAIKQGIQRGMPLRQAYALCPRGLFFPLAEEKYNCAFTQVLSLLSRYSPTIEATATEHAFLDVTYEPDETRFIRAVDETIERETGFHASMAIASNKFVALTASLVASTGQALVIPEGEEKKFLKDLPVDLLPASSEPLRRLVIFGIYKMGELAELPCEAVKLQFGEEGQRLWELANGIDGSRLMPWGEPAMLKEGFCFEPPAENLSFLLAKADELLGRLSCQLKQSWQHCRKLEISLSFSNDHLVQRAFHFKEATASKETMLRHLRHCLEKARFAAPVNELRLSLADLCPEEGKQTSFLDKPPEYKEKLTSAIRGLQQRYGKTVVSRILSRPDAALPEDSFSLVGLNLEEK